MSVMTKNDVVSGSFGREKTAFEGYERKVGFWGGRDDGRIVAEAIWYGDY